MSLNPTTRRRLDIQGFDNVDDAWLAEVAPWPRLAFGLCATLAAIGTVTTSVPVLWALVGVAAVAGLSPVHPFDLIYNLGFRHVRGTRPLPRRGAPTRFACGIGVLWLLATIWAFSTGQLIVGYVLRGALTSVALLVSTTDICISSLVYRLIFGGLDQRPS